jgi:hypothetical protein
MQEKRGNEKREKREREAIEIDRRQTAYLAC